jgi:hypothetical protein
MLGYTDITNGIPTNKMCLFEALRKNVIWIFTYREQWPTHVVQFGSKYVTMCGSDTQYLCLADCTVLRELLPTIFLNASSSIAFLSGCKP